jgi:hypothetical protein
LIQGLSLLLRVRFLSAKLSSDRLDFRVGFLEYFLTFHLELLIETPAVRFGVFSCSRSDFLKAQQRRFAPGIEIRYFWRELGRTFWRESGVNAFRNAIATRMLRSASFEALPLKSRFARALPFTSRLNVMVQLPLGGIWQIASALRKQYPRCVRTSETWGFARKPLKSQLSTTPSNKYQLNLWFVPSPRILPSNAVTTCSSGTGIRSIWRLAIGDNPDYFMSTSEPAR